MVCSNSFFARILDKDKAENLGPDVSISTFLGASVTTAGLFAGTDSVGVEVVLLTVFSTAFFCSTIE
ncbi:hypothetical protein ACYE2N_00035 [Flavobacterium sp. MAHUQ-51]|uniref:hypothetical protein n=1 Tax=Flavobacterium sp. GCM10022190 TaxID=3252639 RepID=UPI00361E0DFC